MKLLVIVLCLLSERFLIHSFSYNRFYWFTEYFNKIKTMAEEKNIASQPWMLFATTIILPVLVVSLIYFLLRHVLFGVVDLIFSIIIFYYCLGPHNVFYPLVTPDTNQENAVGEYFVLANTQLFALIFWYIIAGPVAALAYRLITLSRNFEAIAMEATQATNILEWLPARMAALLYLLAGNFQRGFVSFMSFIAAKPELNNNLLTECGLHAVRTHESDDVPMPVAENLVEHATVILLVLIALFTLAAWL